MTLFLYPPSTRYGKSVPKTQVYAHANAGRALKRLFVEQVEAIVWEHKLSPRTVNLPETGHLREIQVFTLHLRTADPDLRILRALDESIPSALVLELVHGHRVRPAMAWKRPHKQDPSRRVVGDAVLGAWQFLPGERRPLPIVTDLSALHEHLFRSLLPVPAREGESLDAQMERLETLRLVQREMDALRRQIEREPQFNRRMETHSRLQQLQAQADSLN